jgi:vacuolar-type H+-ATPase subunit E/Vma4
MEELQSTEALDREILEDARKKAFKILKSADESAAASKASWERKLEKTLAQAKQSYAEKVEQGRTEIMARLPMDRRRVKSEKIESLLSKAKNDFLSSLDRATILDLLKRELEQRLANADEDGACALRYRGLAKNELDPIVKNINVSSQKEDPLYSIAGSFPAIVLDYPGLRVTASVDAAAADILLDKRAELATALLGSEAAE